MPIQTFPLELQRAKTIAPGVRHLAFKPVDGAEFPFVPGQFITFHWAVDDKPVRRSYSIASIPGQTDEIEIAISYVEGGFASETLFKLEPGDTLNATGPFGRLILRDEAPKRYVLVATGTGVTPYRAMLPTLEHQMITSDLQVVVLLGVQHREDAIYAEDFIALAEKQPQFTFRIQYSREDDLTDLTPFEFKGYVQSSFDELILDPTGDLIYLCGNPVMIDDAFEHAKNIGFTAQQVRREKYIS